MALTRRSFLSLAFGGALSFCSIDAFPSDSDSNADPIGGEDFDHFDMTAEQFNQSWNMMFANRRPTAVFEE